MRPSSRLILVQHLPTISEAYEEVLQDISTSTKCPNKYDINSDSGSTDDYLQSICQLAKPTFSALQDSSCEFQDLSKLNHLRQDQRLLSQVDPDASKISLKNTKKNYAADIISLDNVIIMFETNKKISSQVKFDPLEELYGQKEGLLPNISKKNPTRLLHSKTIEKIILQQKSNTSLKCEKLIKEHDLTNIFSFPQISSSELLQREMSCSELDLQKSGSRQHNTNPNTGTKRISNTRSDTKMNFISLNKHWSRPSKEISPNCKVQRMPRKLQTLPASLVGDVGIKRLESKDHFKDTLKTQTDSQTFQGNNITEKQILISNWLSDCRNVWKDAQKRAYLLPAIAEI
ncbi:uncharacterized protein si:dkeyp-72g9.4 [Heptranchias perlo]|uniref:uncharacterized protein si:dkeyp-72g9.4 n=1 Tax=Heptranchias perlo TaxID=212740 RepID=UPI003559FDFF